MVLGAHHCFLPRSVLLMCLWRFLSAGFILKKEKKRLHVFKRMMMFNKKKKLRPVMKPQLISGTAGIVFNKGQ